MALIVDEESKLKHLCKICKKGFLCGRALGGHMRAHGIVEDQGMDWEEKIGEGNTSPNNKRMYALRTNPNRQRSNFRACENCGKEFSSWKSFLEHGKCRSDDDDDDDDEESPRSNEVVERRPCVWSKRKRSFRTNIQHFDDHINVSNNFEDDDDLAANCLMMLSNGMVSDQQEEYWSCASASKDNEEMRRNNPIILEYDNYCKAKAAGSINSKGLFECKACKKVFNSHQALGGHRASHKKVKGCFAASDFIRSSSSSSSLLQSDDEHGNKSRTSTSTRTKSKVHECSICHRVFSSGQALGGHKRCHWITSNVAEYPSSSTIVRFHQQQIEHASLDLNNMPAASHDEDIMGDHNNSLSSFEVSTQILLQSWGAVNLQMKPHHCHIQQNHNEREDDDNINNDRDLKQTNNYVYQSNPANNYKQDNELDNKVKLTQLCDIKDHITTNACSSPWLQVGISSTNNTIGPNP